MVGEAVLSLSAAALFVWVVFVGPFCWVLRDGLGPDSVSSSGFTAVCRALMTFYWGPVALLLLAAIIASRYALGSTRA